MSSATQVSLAARLPPMLPTGLSGALVVAIMVYISRAAARRGRNPRGLPLPPGPKGHPFIGNLLQLPRQNAVHGFDKMCKEHGDLVYLDVMGKPILLLGTLERAADLMEKRSSVWSSRSPLETISMMDVAWIMVAQPYGSEWRVQRRTFHQQLNGNMLARFQPIFDEEIPTFLAKLKESPEDFLKHSRELFGYTIMRIAYGSDEPGVNRELLQDGRRLAEGFSAAVAPGRYLVNILPFMKYIPAWFPGAKFKTECDEIRSVSHRVLVDSFQHAQDELQKGRRGTHPSMAASLISSMPEIGDPGRPEYVRVAQSVCAVAYTGGADTTNSSLSALYLALAMYPKVQAKAQQEIDVVVGKDRLPTVDDKESLPYVSALVKELFRWHTPVPLVLHASTKDEEYDGYFIPKGTRALMNVWALMHDPNTFDDPLEFIPERYLKDGKLNPTALDPLGITFGYGRRICPGVSLTERTIFLVAASLLATFDIRAPKDDSGKPIPLKLELSPTLEAIAEPLPFKVDIRLRSPLHAKLFHSS